MADIDTAPMTADERADSVCSAVHVCWEQDDGIMDWKTLRSILIEFFQALSVSKTAEERTEWVVQTYFASSGVDSKDELFAIAGEAIRAAEAEAEQRGEERAIAVVLDHLSETTAGYLVAAIRARAKQQEPA